jgi:hypothetical protein
VSFDDATGSGFSVRVAKMKKGGRQCRMAPNSVISRSNTAHSTLALRRFAQLFPDRPIILDGDGRTYDEIAAARRSEKKDCTGC